MAARSTDIVIRTYSHDDLARIAQVDCGSGKWGQTFTFDAFGNIKKTVISGHTGTSFTPNYGPTTNQLTCTGCSYSYDSNGNLLGDGVSTYTWDAEGNLSQFNLGTALVYDALGRRVEQTNASGTNEILYGPDGSKLALMSGRAVAKAFVPLPGGATAVYSGSTLGWYRHPDWLGSSRIASTPSRTVSSDGAASYSPFGESPTETGDHNFTGQNQDLVPNFLYDFPAREYHPGEGRWLSPDPAGMAAADPTNPQSWNRYEYANNSPLDSVDPSGLDTTKYMFSGGCLYSSSSVSMMAVDPINHTWSYTVAWTQWEVVMCASQQPGTSPAPGGGGGNPGGGGTTGTGGGGGGGGLVQWIKGKVCSAVPQGRVVGVQGAIGGVGGQTGTLEQVFNYTTGETSVFASGGVQAGWNGGAQGNVFGGLIYGDLKGNNSGYTGGFTTVSGAWGLGGYVSSSSGGMRNPVPNGQVNVVGVTGGVSLIDSPTGTISATHYTAPLLSSKFTGFNAQIDLGFFLARQVCK